MAITPTCKVTYSLRPAAVARVQELALKWGVPKSEVIRRVVENVSAEKAEMERALTPRQALDRLQKNGISAGAAARYIREIRAERRAWGRKKK
jgi:hypothetical protein